MKALTFSKGIHPDDCKHYTESKPIEHMPLAKEVFIPLQQHIGAPCKPIVAKKDKVKAGQLIGEPTGFVSSPVHASISGTVKAIDFFFHPIGIPVEMIHIVGDPAQENDKDICNINDKTINATSDNSWEHLTSKEIISTIHKAGIVGMGGAGFPTHVKLSPPENKPIDTLVVNGCECEPYLTADHRSMLDKTQEIATGIRILAHALKASKVVIGIEDNTPDAIESMKQATKDFKDISIIALKSKYPQGAEKFLIKATLNRTVPSGGLPMDVGVVVNNIATCIAIHAAITTNKPLIERVVTVTGDGIKEPKNLITRIGTPFRDLINYCGGLLSNTSQVIMGGPMMGLAQYSLDVPVVKATSGILCLTDDSLFHEQEFACIKCGTCIQVCPLNLMPTKLAGLTRIGNIKAAESLGIQNCADCGCCAYSCPSHIPLVQWLRLGKLKLAEIKKKNAKKT